MSEPRGIDRVAAVLIGVVKSAITTVLVRVEALEARAAVPGPVGPPGAKGQPGEPGPEGLPGRDGRDGISIPGPTGETGTPGRDGTNGQDGRNGTVAELRLKLVPVDARRWQLYAGDGVPVEGGLLKFDHPLYKGVYVEGTRYELADMVTWAGAMWYAKEDTAAKPGEGATPWRLAVKAGRDGKAGKDGKDGINGKDGKDAVGPSGQRW